MFIKDGVYREIDVKVDAPIAEGTILTFGGTLAAEDASDAFGIVPENIYVLPPTKKTRVVIGGTIDLDDPANKGVEFSEAVVNALGADINFVPAAEAGSGGSVPSPAAADTGKVLTANNGAVEWAENGIFYTIDENDPVYLYSYNDFATFLTKGKTVVAYLINSSEPSRPPKYVVLTALGFENGFYMASFGSSEINSAALLVAETATEPMHFD